MKAKVLFAMFVVAGSLLGFTQEGAPQSGSSKILALENVWNQAWGNKDLKAMDMVLDDAFVYVGFDGRLMTKAEFLTDVKASGVQQVVTESMATHLHGDAAFVTGIYQMKAIQGGRPVLHRGRFVDAWVHKDGSWVCVVSQATPMK